MEIEDKGLIPQATDIGTKVCTKCGREFPETVEFFTKDKNRKDGLNPWCKECTRAATRHYREANSEKVKESGRLYREANKDKLRESKRLYREANQDKIRESAHLYREANRDKIVETNRLYREANRDKMREFVRHWAKANPERERERHRLYREANPERERERHRLWCEANPEKCAESCRRWQKANPEKVRAISRRYRARKLNAKGSHTAEEVQAQYERQKGKCYWCKRKIGDSYHVDHVIPLNKGGRNSIENLVIACPYCNQSKHDQMPAEFAGRLI